MTEMELREEIRSYEPFNEQEREDKKEILRQMEQADHILTRDNRNAHITVSAWIMDRDRKKVLMAYHNLYQSCVIRKATVASSPLAKETSFTSLRHSLPC